VTREYGAGGYEVAHRLAEVLGWELLDRELLHRAAAVAHLPDADLERLDEKAISMADRFRLHPPHQQYIQALREAASQAAAKGNVVLVGRGTGQLLLDLPNVFHLRLAAPREWRAQRMAQQQGWTFEQALARCSAEDRTRDRFTRYFFGEAPFQLAQYHLAFNTGRVPLEDVAASVATLLQGEAASDPLSQVPRSRIPQNAGIAGPHSGECGYRRVLTLSRELGAGDTGFPRALADRLGLKVYDRELLEQEAKRLGVTEAELERVDEQPASLFQRFSPGSLSHRYFEALGTLMKELAERGNVLLVGRGGSRFLRDLPEALHVRLVAPPEVRIRRVMEHRWLREAQARKLIAQTDTQRRNFYQSYFGADWSDLLEYHVTANSGRLGPAAARLLTVVAERFWNRGQG
jgi:cytidylate kinase